MLYLSAEMPHEIKGFGFYVLAFVAGGITAIVQWIRTRAEITRIGRDPSGGLRCCLFALLAPVAMIAGGTISAESYV